MSWQTKQGYALSLKYSRKKYPKNAVCGVECLLVRAQDVGQRCLETGEEHRCCSLLGVCAAPKTRSPPVLKLLDDVQNRLQPSFQHWPNTISSLEKSMGARSKRRAHVLIVC